MIWDLHLVHKIESLRTQAVISQYSLASAHYPDEVKAVYMQEVEHEFRAAAQTHGVDLDSRDLHFKWEEQASDEFGTVWKLRVRWWPESREVQLVGGPADGTQQVLDEQTFASGQLRVIVAQHALPLPELENPPDSIAMDVATYRIMGWHEEGRFWTMQPV